jgi:hypothetical protein
MLAHGSSSLLRHEKVRTLERRLVMKKLVMVALASALLLTVLTSLSVHTAKASSTVGTYTITDLGQGAWGGGSLNADGTLGGGASYSAGNGSLVGTLVPTTWSFVNGGTAVSLCFIVQPIKGPPLFPSGCLVVPVTGTPIVVTEDMEGSTLIRVTLH